MKIILLVVMFCFSAYPASAYKEDSRIGETQMTAGEQNSNLYRLQSRGSEILKKLKQADEYVGRAQASGKQVNASALEDLLNSEQKDRAEHEIEKLSVGVRQQTAEYTSLRVVPDHSTYELLTQMHLKQQKDREAAQQLLAVLQQRRGR